MSTLPPKRSNNNLSKKLTIKNLITELILDPFSDLLF